jgi:long-chain acyl-CoA synthetase
MSLSDRQWTAFYGPSMRTEIAAAQYRTIGDMVSAVSHLYKDQPAFTAWHTHLQSG